MKFDLSENSIIVIKIGTSSLTNIKGAIDLEKIQRLAHQIFILKSGGYRIVLVSSGAIRVGMEKLQINERPKNLPELQACAAVGQSRLMEIYSLIFEKYNIPTAQILVTQDDFRNRNRFLNSRNTIQKLLDLDCIPIVNENDTVAIDEIKFGENDTLSAIVSASIDADLLINLSDIDGLYTDDPKKNPNAKKINVVEKISKEIITLAGDSSTNVGSGGMLTKIKAATIATNSGVKMIIANAAEDDIILKACSKENIGTSFLACRNTLAPKKRWIAFAAKSNGSITVNVGATEKISKAGKSILPAGVTAVSGYFKQGDMIDVYNENNEAFAKGIVYYSSNDINKIMGKQSSEIENILGHKDFDEIIHHNNLVITKIQEG